LSGSNDLFWATSTNRLGILTNAPDYPLDVRGAIRTGGPGVSGQLRIYSEQGTTDYELVFAATSTMTTTTIYYFPPNYGGPNYVLTTDGSGNLIWQSVSGVGGLTGSGTTNRLAKWTATQSLGDASILDNATTVIITLTNATTTILNNLTVSGTGRHSFDGILDPNQVDAFTLIGNITGSGTPSITGIGTFAGNIAQLAQYLQVPTVQSDNATLTLKTLTSGDIILDPASGKILLGANDWIETSQGYQIGKSGTQVLREMVPIMGFDLPFRCGNACNTATTVSRTIEDYPFSPAATGATRVHKFVIRYADTGTTASSTWIVYNETDATTTATFTVPATNSDLAKGKVYITGNVNIPPAGKKWHLKLQTPSGMTIQVYQIFLAAYDQIL
jgi:hypothetical protein